MIDFRTKLKEYKQAVGEIKSNTKRLSDSIEKLISKKKKDTSSISSLINKSTNILNNLQKSVIVLNLIKVVNQIIEFSDIGK